MQYYITYTIMQYYIIYRITQYYTTYRICHSRLLSPSFLLRNREERLYFCWIYLRLCWQLLVVMVNHSHRDYLLSLWDDKLYQYSDFVSTESYVYEYTQYTLIIILCLIIKASGAATKLKVFHVKLLRQKFFKAERISRWKHKTQQTSNKKNWKK